MNSLIVVAVLALMCGVNGCSDRASTPVASDADQRLLLAVAAGDARAARQHLAEGTNPDAVHASGLSALHLALRSEHPYPLIAALLAAGADPMAPDSNRQTPLFAALERTQPWKVVCALINAGADPTRTNTEGLTAIEAAFDRGFVQPEFIDCVHRSGVSMNELLFGGRSIVHLAARNGSIELMKAIHQRGGDPVLPDHQGMTPLMHAAQTSDIFKLTELIEADRDINATDSQGRNALMHMAEHPGFTDLTSEPLGSISLFVQHPAIDLSHRDEDGRTALMHFAHRTWAGPIDMVSSRPHDIDARDNQGMTALMIAAKENPHPSAISMLLKHGANPTLRDESGRSAVDYARENINLRGAEVIAELEAALKGAATSSSP